MSEEEKEETHIEKRRTTALKIIVDEKTRESEAGRRKFFAELFDFPEYTISEEVTIVSVTRPVRGVDEVYSLYEDVLAVLRHNNIDVTTFAGYSEKKATKFKNNSWELDQQVKKVTGISDQTYLHFKHGGSETSKQDVNIFYLLFELQTSGRTKTEIKGIHKQNVCKFLNYLRMRKVPYQYDCEWAFEGTRACQL